MYCKFILSAFLALVLVTSNAAAALLTFNFQEVDGDVVITATGSVDLAGLTYSEAGLASGFLRGSQGIIYVGSGPELEAVDSYAIGSFVRPIYGTGYSNFIPTSGNGGVVGLSGNSSAPSDYIILPSGYVSLAELHSVSVFGGETFESMGLSLGTYEFSFLNNTVIYQIGPVNEVPLPAAFSLFLFGVLGLVGVRQKKVRA